MPDRRGVDLELSDFWNMAGGGGEADPDRLDPATAAAVRRIRVLASAPLPGLARERVWRGLMGTTESTIAKERTMTPVADVFGSRPTAGQNGRLPSPRASPRGQPTFRQREFWTRPILPISLALLLLTGLTGGWLWLGAPRPGAGGEPHALITAPLVTPAATPDPATFDGVLIDTVLANQPLTSQYIDVERLIFAAGDGIGENDNRDSNMALIVTAGKVTVTVDGPTQLFKNIDADAQPAEANVPQPLRAGEALVWGPGTHFRIEHRGEAPAVIVAFNILDPNINGPTLRNVALRQLSQGNATFAPGPLRLIVRRVSLMPGETFRRPVGGPLLILGPEDPSASISGYLIGDANNYGATPANLLVMTLEPVGGTSVTPMSASPAPA